MSSSHPTSKEHPEMDLVDLGHLLRSGFYQLLALFFKALFFLIKMWWVLLLLIAAGVVAGYFLNAPEEKQSIVLLKTNYSVQPMVYNAIKEQDKAFSKNDSLSTTSGQPEILGLKIEPIIDIVSLLEKIGSTDRFFNSVLEELDYEEEDEIPLLASEMFYFNHDYHKLYINHREGDILPVVNSIVASINNKPLIQDLKKSGLASQLAMIAANEQSINQIDSLIIAETGSIKDKTKALTNLQVYNEQSSVNSSGLLTLKRELIEVNQSLKNELPTMQTAVVILSGAQTNSVTSWDHKWHILLPLLLVFGFLGVALLIYFYRETKKTIG